MLAAGLAGKVSGARLSRRAYPFLSIFGFVALCVAAVPATFSQTAASQAAPSPVTRTAQPQPSQNKKSKEAPAPPATPVPPAPTVAPNLFDQPAAPATVTTENNELTVKAENSSLAQILHQVSSKTGMRLDGLGGDERVFGSFGPAAPREVLTALLNGTSYNVVMVGDLPNGAPRELLLSRRTGGGATPPPAMGQAQNPTSGPNGNQNPDQAAQNDQNGDDSAAQDDSGNNSDDSSDDSAPPMQYTPPSIAPADNTPTPADNVPAPGDNTPQNPRVAPPMQSAPE